jgi:hypothetical protein
MNSIVQVEVSKKYERIVYGILVSLALTVSVDDNPDENTPSLSFLPETMFMSYEMLGKGIEHARKSAEEFLTAYAAQQGFTIDGYNKLREAIFAFLDKQDIAKISAGWFADPVSPTRH